MDEIKQNEPVHSSARAETTAVEAPAVPTTTVKSSGTDKMGTGAPPTLKTPMAGLLDLGLLNVASIKRWASPAEFVAFLKRTRRVWMATSGAIIGVVALVATVNNVTHWAKNRRERRQEQAVASVTPERLIARCGPPAEDVTKEVYPILMRTMSYEPRSSEKLVVAFSRTAEEKSDWVFLSMRDDIAPGTYDTPQAKLAAMPCMDSKK
jgi:hypothetical protein